MKHNSTLHWSSWLNFLQGCLVIIGVYFNINAAGISLICVSVSLHLYPLSLCLTHAPSDLNGDIGRMTFPGVMGYKTRT